MSKKVYNETIQAKMLSKLLKKGTKTGVSVSGGGTPMVNTTYAELKALRDNGKLVAGQQYRITDYDGEIAETDDVISARHQFDIIVVADDTHTLNENARAALHEGDTYFAGQNLEKWELKYNIDNIGNYGKVGGKQASFEIPAIGVLMCGMLTENDTTYEGLPYKIDSIQFQGVFVIAYLSELSDKCTGYLYIEDEVTSFDKFGGITNLQVGEELPAGHGVVTWLKDDKDNSMYYDFKNIKYARYRITSYLGEEPKYDMYGLPDIEYNEEESSIIFDLEDKVFMFTFDDNGNDGSLIALTSENHFGINSLNCVFYNTTDELFHCKANKLADNCINNTFWNKCYSNVLGSYSYSNTFGKDCQYNIFENNCCSNIFGNRCYSNIFRNDCYTNTFGSNSHDNTFGNNCYTNTFGKNSYLNTFGSTCNFNIFGDECIYNTFGINCQGNIFGDGCESNKFGNSCYNNTFGYRCEGNTFGNLCGNNAFGNNCSHNIFSNGCYTNIFGNSCIYNTFGIDCDYNIFGSSASSLMSYAEYITLEAKVYNININCAETTSINKRCKNVHINSGVSSTNVNKTITIPTAGNNFLTTIGTANDTKINV